MNQQHAKIIEFIRNLYQNESYVTLHEPRFIGNEKKYVSDAIDSTFVSSVGQYVDRFEERIAQYVGTKYAVATVNGTAALHSALLVAGVGLGDEVITQPLTFIATANAIAYTGAQPVFLDVDRDTFGLSPQALQHFLEAECEIVAHECINRTTGKTIRACVPMHTFGHPCKIDEIKKICDQWNIILVEDAAESLGSFYKNRHAGTFGKLGIFSFNGNKIITSGGGGVIVTDDEELAKRAKHLTTTAKVPHPWEYDHDQIGYNYRLPNLNAALLVAQLEQLPFFLDNKRILAREYQSFFESIGVRYIMEPDECRSNYWLNGIIFDTIKESEEFLQYSNEHGVMCRAVWKLSSELKMFNHCQTDELENARYFEKRVVNIPSSVRL